MSAQRKPPETGRDPDFVGAEAAMRRAARRARKRAGEVANASAPLTSPGNASDLHETGPNTRTGPRSAKRPVVVSQAPHPGTPAQGTFYGGASPRTRPPGAEASRVADEVYTFSQMHGYEEIPGPLKLEDLPKEARTRIWNLFFEHIRRCTTTGGLDVLDGGPWIKGPWSDILEAKHRRLDHAPLDEWNSEYSRVRRSLREDIEKQPFNKVFDLIQFVLGHRECPRAFIRQMKTIFAESRLAYTIDIGPPPAIMPAVTPEEGNVVVEALRELREAGLDGSAAQLRNASRCLNVGDWAGSIRESIHAVVSVARQVAPGSTKALKPALDSLERHGALHSALRRGLSALYGYTSNEQGIRHELLDRPEARVGQDEAVFMLGACASFASFLWRKHVAGHSS